MKHCIIRALFLVMLIALASGCAADDSERIAALEATIAALSQQQQGEPRPQAQEPDSTATPYPTSTAYPSASPLPTYTPLPTPTPFRPADLPGAYNYRDVPRPTGATICSQTPFATYKWSSNLYSKTCYIVSANDTSYDDLMSWGLEEIPHYGWRHTKTSDNGDYLSLLFEPVASGTNYKDLHVDIQKVPGEAGNCSCEGPERHPLGHYTIGYFLDVHYERWSIFLEGQ